MYPPVIGCAPVQAGCSDACIHHVLRDWRDIHVKYVRERGRRGLSGYVAASALKVTRVPQPQRPHGLLASAFAPSAAFETSVSQPHTPVSSCHTSSQLLHSHCDASVHGSDKGRVVFTMGSGGLSHGASRSRSSRSRPAPKSTAATSPAMANFAASRKALTFEKSQRCSRDRPRSLREVFAGPHANLAMLAAERSPSVETACDAASPRLHKHYKAADVAQSLCMLPPLMRPAGPSHTVVMPAEKFVSHPASAPARDSRGFGSPVSHRIGPDHSAASSSGGSCSSSNGSPRVVSPAGLTSEQDAKASSAGSSATSTCSSPHDLCSTPQIASQPASQSKTRQQAAAEPIRRSHSWLGFGFLRAWSGGERTSTPSPQPARICSEVILVSIR